MGIPHIPRPEAYLALAQMRARHYDDLMQKVTRENGNVGANHIQRRHMMDDSIAVESNSLLAIAGFLQEIRDLLEDRNQKGTP